ncbi:MAG: helix-turn-helix domain-containing protein [Clostridiales bacterium]|nr:helix-turn-helix domain-containing protein [Clostridiales bacterium]
MKLKDIRKQKGLSQEEASVIIGVTRRTYAKYENDENKQSNIKYKAMCQVLSEYGFIDEETGILTVELIKEACVRVFSNYKVDYCYLFGSYAKGKATPTSDVDLFVSTKETGLRFFGLVEDLRIELKKKVDLLNQEQIKNNFELTNEIFSSGVKIYG